MQISSKLLFSLTSLFAAVLVFAPLTFSVESSSAAIPFSDSFGSTASDEVTNWDEDSSTGTNETKIIGSGGQTGLPNDGHARIAAGGFIRRTIDASGFNSLTLKYYYRHVSSAESSDQGFVEYCEGASCDSSWQNLATVDIDPGNANLNDWSAQQSIALPSALDNSLFRIRFRNGAGDEPEFFRIDDAEVLGTEIEEEEDTTPPTSAITSPQEGSFWNEPILIEGSSTDVPDTTVDYITLWFSVSGDEDWVEIAQINNDQLSEPFEWSYNWVPEEEGTYDIKAEATDTAGNTEESPQVNNVTYDITNPTSDIEYPEDEQTYTQDTWNEEISGTASDEPSSGVSTVYVSTQADDGSYWWEEGLDFFCDDGNEDDQCDEILNEADFDGEFWSFEFDFISEEGIQGYTVRSHAEDNAGNLEETNTVHFYFSTDTTAPTSTIDSPGKGSFWNEPIEIFGSSTDEPETTVDYVKFYYRTSGEEENTWNEIPDSQQNNEDEVDPFDWSFNWTPDEEGTFDIKAEATDKAGNVESSPVVEYVTYDVTDPTSEISSPEEGARYIEDVWDDGIRGTSSDSPSSGVATVLVSIQRDTDGLYWDGGGWSEGRGDGEILNEDVDFNEEDGIWDFGFAYIEPEGADEGYTARSHAVDNAGNQEDTNIVHFFFGRAPIISDETESTVSTSSVTITWTTDFLATSRVIYDTVSHPILGEAPNYGYASSTAEFDTDPKVTSHSVTVDDLTAGTTYSYRTVSHGSPEAVGDEKSFTTTNPAAAAAASTAGTDGGGGGTAPTCGDTKPGSAPTLTGASAGTNGVSLTWSQAEGPVTYYLVTYGTSPGAQQFGNPNVGGAGTTSYTVSGLSGGVTYYFKVRAGNGCAPGDFSNELSATPGGGFVAGPAAGFAPGVLGTEEEATPAAAPTAEALGEKGEETPSAISGRVRTLIIIFLILSGLGIAYWYWQGRSRRLFKEQG